MNLRFTTKMLEDPETLVFATALLVNSGSIESDGKDSVYKLDYHREKLVDKVKLEKLVANGVKVYGSLHLYAEVDDAFLNQPVPDTFPGSKKKDKDGKDNGTRSWKDQSLISKGNKGKSLIRFVDIVSGRNGNPKGMSVEDFERYRERFPDYITLIDKEVWEVENMDVTDIGSKKKESKKKE